MISCSIQKNSIVHSCCMLSCDTLTQQPEIFYTQQTVPLYVLFDELSSFYDSSIVSQLQKQLRAKNILTQTLPLDDDLCAKTLAPYLSPHVLTLCYGSGITPKRSQDTLHALPGGRFIRTDATAKRNEHIDALVKLLC